MPGISGFISALHFQRVANTTLPHKHSYLTICAFKTHTWCRVGMESVSNALSIPPRLPLHIPLQSRKYSPISTIHQPSLPICRSLRGPLVSHILKALFIRCWSGKVCASRAHACVCVCIYACVRHPVSVLLLILMCGSTFSPQTPAGGTTQHTLMFLQQFLSNLFSSALPNFFFRGGQ